MSNNVKRAAWICNQRSQSRYHLRHVPWASSIILGGFVSPAHAGDLPTDGTIAAGTATISATNASTTIDQSSARAVINWTSFSVGAGNSVTFNQPDARSATLNRATGNTSSEIAGLISSNGAVYLVNPNGIAITPTGAVHTGGGFVASSLDIADGEFMAGMLNFSGSGASATVENAGSIAAGQGSFVALLGGSVANSGHIAVPLGKIGLGSGEQVALDLNGGNFMQIAVPTSAIDGGSALVDNSGAISASGGYVLLTAATLKDAVRNVVNMSGSISADSAVSDGGSIVLLGGDGGRVNVSGSLTARATGASGNGGFIETSGHDVDLNGITIDTRAANGETGTWLIDPPDFVIAPAGGDITGAGLSANLAASNVYIESSMGSGSAAGDVTVGDAVTWSSGNALYLSAFRNVNMNSSILATGANAGLVLRADNTGTGSGTVLFGSGITARLTGAGSTARVYYNPAVFGTPTSFTGRVIGPTATAVTAYQLVNTLANLQSINLSSARLTGNYALGLDLDASATASWNGGAGFVPLATNGAGSVLNGVNGYNGSFDGLGHVISNLTINRPSAAYVGLFGYLGPRANITNVGLSGGSVAGYSNVGGLAGYTRGLVANSSATGSVTGTFQVGGLVGFSQTGTIRDSFATGAVSGTGFATNLGGLLGYDYSGVVSSSYATGAVTGFESVGGLVGTTVYTTLSGSHATGAVSGVLAVGGLAGTFGYGAITGSYATGAVTGELGVGGLVGDEYYEGTISSSYATGDVSGEDRVGGLVGNLNYGAISSSYATGDVSGDDRVGGLVGYGHFESTIDDSYATGGASGTTNVGGLVGYDDATAISDSYAAGPISGVQNFGGLVGYLTNSEFADRHGYITNSHYNVDEVLINGGHVLTVGGLFDAEYQDWLGNGLSLDVASYLGAPDADGFYGIGSLADFKDLLGFADDPTLKFKLTSDIDLVSAPGLFIPYLRAELDGAGHSVSNLLLDQNTSNLGFVGVLYAGAISDLAVIGGSVTGFESVGGLVGYDLFGGTISGSHAAVAVAGDWFVGGLVGYDFFGGTISDSHATGSVSGSNHVGGLVGRDYSGAAISTSYATGAVAGSGNFVGGLVGYDESGPISGSYATGAVSGGDYVGGLVGNHGYAPISDSYATGTVAGYDYVGGLIGSNSNGDLSNSFATGAVGGDEYVGGLVGYNYLSSIDGSSASGDVGGATFVGGLIGLNYSSSLSDSHAEGDVTASGDYAGGLVAYNYSSSISASFATGDAVGNNYVGGLAGVNDGTITDTYARGAAIARIHYAGGLVAFNSGAIATSYATGKTKAKKFAGGLIGTNLGTVITSYWNKQTTGQAKSDGGIGLNDNQLSSYSLSDLGFSDSVWGADPNEFPYLLWENP